MSTRTFVNIIGITAILLGLSMCSAFAGPTSGQHTQDGTYLPRESEAAGAALDPDSVAFFLFGQPEVERDWLQRFFQELADSRKASWIFVGLVVLLAIMIIWSNRCGAYFNGWHDGFEACGKWGYDEANYELTPQGQAILDEAGKPQPSTTDSHLG